MSKSLWRDFGKGWFNANLDLNIPIQTRRTKLKYTSNQIKNSNLIFDFAGKDSFNPNLIIGVGIKK
jgi:hypothetical protein